jgi:hypothetical protein
MKTYILAFLAPTFLAMFLIITFDNNSIVVSQGLKDLLMLISSTANGSTSKIFSMISTTYPDRSNYAFASNSFDDKNSAAENYGGNFSGSMIDRSTDTVLDNLTKMMDMRNLTMRNEQSLNNEINRSSSTDTSGALSAPPTITTITYSPKFVCGPISSSNGPLRPGYYDTDISIFNKQDYPIKFLWNIVITDGLSSNAIIKKLSAETSTKISCSDLFVLFPNNVKFLEGFIVITLPISGNILDAFPDTRNNGVSILRPVNPENADLIDVQVFYTANALPHLPQNIIVEKILFRILNDSSSKIPKTLLNMDLEVAFVLEPDKIYDPIERIKTTLVQQYGLSDIEARKVKVKIDQTDVSTSFQQDDHAISSSRILPDIRYGN